MNEQKALTVRQAAAFLDISVSHLYKLTSRGEIPHYKPGGKRVYFLPEDLIKYIKQGEVRTAEEIESEAANYVVQ